MQPPLTPATSSFNLGHALIPRLPRTGLLFRIVKAIDIFYVGILFFLVAGSMSFLLDRAYPAIRDGSTTGRLVGEMVGMAMLMPVIAYVARNVVYYLPSPFHGFAGLDHYRLRELGGSVIVAFSLFTFQSRLRQRVSEVQRRMNIGREARAEPEGAPEVPQAPPEDTPGEA